MNTGKTEDKIEFALKDTIRNRWGDKFHSKDWRAAAFTRYTEDEDEARTVVHEAVDRVAHALSLELTEKQKLARQALRSKITLDLTPKKIFHAISQVIELFELHPGPACPDGKSRVYEAVRKPDGSIVFEWICK